MHKMNKIFKIDIVNNLQRFENTFIISRFAGPSGRAVEGLGLRQLACWDRGFESRRRHGCLSFVSVVCCQVEMCVTSWSLVQRNSTDCGASLCVI